MYNSGGELFVLVKHTILRFGMAQSCNFKKLKVNETKIYVYSSNQITTKLGDRKLKFNWLDFINKQPKF